MNLRETDSGEPRQANAHLSALPLRRRVERWARWGLLLAVLLGIGCRIAQYLANMSYWSDEASLVLNIRGKTATQLMGPLDYAQAAPPLFLLAERGLYRAFGGGERSLRLLPLCCGIAALLLFAALARKILDAPWALFAVLLVALSDRLIAHGAEVKPYIGDVFVCTLFLWLAIPRRGSPDPEKRLARLAAFAVAAAWFSFPSVLVFGAMSLALMPGVVKRSGRGLARYLLLNLPVVLSFAALLLLTRQTQKNVVFTDYWKDSFIDWHRPLHLPYWFCRRMAALCDYGNPAAGPVMCAGLVLGAVALWKRRNGQLLAILLGPIAMAFLPAALHRYPFDGARLTVFLSPCVIALSAIGFQELVAAFAHRFGRAIYVPMAYVLAISVYWCGLHLVVPRNRGHLRPVAQFVHDHVQPGDTIYVFDGQPFRCYWTPNDPRLRDELDRADQIPSERFWVVWSFGNRHGAEKPAPALQWAREFCREEMRFDDRGGAAVLFHRQVGKLPGSMQPPYNGVDVAQGRQRAADLIKGQ